MDFSQTIDQLRREGKTYEQIASVFGISRQRVHQLMKKYKVDSALFGRVDHLRPKIKSPNLTNRNSVKDWEDPVYWLWRKLQTNAKLSKEVRHQLFNHLKDNLPITCPVLGLQLDYSINTPRTDCSPSIDRVDNNLGYVEGNVCVISWRANRIKMDGTATEHRKIASYIENFRNLEET